ncbi:MAG: sialidase family protein [Candidatus Poribacteria bacterium]
MMYNEIALFISGEGGYHTYRIPAVIISGKGTILAFCEGRKNSSSDSGDIDIVMRRSFDNGKSWENMQVILDDGKDTVGNPAPVFDRETGVIWMLITRNLAEGPESMIIEGKAPRTAWITCSQDDGETWAELKEITQDVKKPSWTWYATGPCHGIQLKSGRLVIPCDHVEGTSRDYAESAHSHIIYSDDHGKTWHIGGITQKGTNECVAVETVDESLYLNCRNYVGAKRRACAWSYDKGNTFTDFGYHEKLVEPICQASMIRFSDSVNHDKNRVLFSNPASTNRERMTVRISYDECKSWNSGKVLYEGPSAYSDLCVTSDMTIGCLYERGKSKYYETISFAQFDLEWLKESKVKS